MTTLVVRDAMKSVAKDVISPKVVRDGIVKPIYRPAPQKKVVDFIILNNTIKLKGKKEVLNTPKFGQEQKFATIIDDYEEGRFPLKLLLPTRTEYHDVELILDIKPKKLKKILELIKKQKQISFFLKFKNKTKVTSLGHLSSISNINELLDEEIKLTYRPDYFNVL